MLLHESRRASPAHRAPTGRSRSRALHPVERAAHIAPDLVEQRESRGRSGAASSRASCRRTETATRSCCTPSWSARSIVRRSASAAAWRPAAARETAVPTTMPKLSVIRADQSSASRAHIIGVSPGTEEGMTRLRRRRVRRSGSRTEHRSVRRAASRRTSPCSVKDSCLTLFPGPSVWVLVLPPRAGNGVLRFRRSIEQEVGVRGDERVGRHHRVGVVDGPVLVREGDPARAFA